VIAEQMSQNRVGLTARNLEAYAATGGRNIPQAAEKSPGIRVAIFGRAQIDGAIAKFKGVEDTPRVEYFVVAQDFRMRVEEGAQIITSAPPGRKNQEFLL
jgi:hypothetical protein